MNTLGILRPIALSDLELMLAWRNAPKVRMNMYTRHEISLKEHSEWWQRTKVDNKQAYFMFELGGSSLGVVGFNNIDNVNKNSCWAFYASPDAPRGTGTKMEFLAVEHAFNHLKLHKLYCEVLAFNEPVIKLHHKFGFKTEGVFIGHHMMDNEFIDVYRLGLLANEWNSLRSAMKEKIEKFSKG